MSLLQHLGRQVDARLDVMVLRLLTHELVRCDIARLTLMLSCNARPSMHHGRRLDLSAGQNLQYTDSAMLPSSATACTGIGGVKEVVAGAAKELRDGVWSVIETDNVDEHWGSMVGSWIPSHTHPC